MDYEALLQELYHLERFGIKLGLDTITELLGYMGNPQRRFKTVHVTGTNGKGSVCAYIASVLQKAGYRVGLFTSPHLGRFNEVGMGGRMDATNVVRPRVAVITRIGLEHTEHLGKTEDRIAREKSGIIKPGCWVVTVDQPTLSVIADQASANGCPMSVVGRDVRYRRLSFGLRGQRIRLENGGGIEFEIPLLGAYQPENAALAYAAIQGLIRMGLKVPNDAVVSGFRETSWPGRLQIVRSHPTVIVDG